MKILIIGEYSSFAKNLKVGFERMGHEVVIFQDGDGWKKIEGGLNTYTYPFKKNLFIFNKQIRKTWILNSIRFTPKFQKDKKNFKSHFDNILILNSEFVRLEHEIWLPQFSINDIKYIGKKNAGVYLSACGIDYAYLNYSQKFRYSPFLNLKNSPYFSKRGVKIINKINEVINGVIPVMFEYTVAHKELQKINQINIFKTIPLPVDLQNIKSENELKEKIVIFHGLNTSMKGSEFIIEALNVIKNKYIERVEVIMDGKMPLNVYLEFLRRTNIVVDQCYGYGYGMNAIYSMALGKVVLSGNEPENELEFKYKDIPVINILPSVNDIVNKLESFILNPNLISEYSKRSVEFVNKFHNTDIVAKQYIELFEQNSKIHTN